MFYETAWETAATKADGLFGVTSKSFGLILHLPLTYALP